MLQSGLSLPVSSGLSFLFDQEFSLEFLDDAQQDKRTDKETFQNRVWYSGMILQTEERFLHLSWKFPRDKARIPTAG